MARLFIYVKSTDRVIGFDRNLLGRADITLINEEQALRITSRSEERRRRQVEDEQEAQIRQAMTNASRGAGAELMGTEFERPTPQIVDHPQQDLGEFGKSPLVEVRATMAPPDQDPDLQPSAVNLADAIEQLGR